MTGDVAIDEPDDMFVLMINQGKTASPDQAKALADIAEAIYQAQQQAVDTVVADANQNNTVPFDMDVLSATVVDEVRRTLSAVMIAELPQMVRDAVSEAIRALPADARGQSIPTTGNPSAAKTVDHAQNRQHQKSCSEKSQDQKSRHQKSQKTGQKPKKT